MTRLGDLAIKFRWLVIAFWAVSLVIGGASASQLSDRLSLDFSLPGQPGDDAERALLATYGTTNFDNFLAVVKVAEGADVTESAEAVQSVLDKTAAAVPEARVTSFYSTGDEAFISEDGSTTFAIFQGPYPQSFAGGIELKLEPALAEAAQGTDLDVGLTSYGLLSAGGESEGPSVLAETLLGATGALVILIFVFASFLALVPLIIAAVAILTTFSLVLLLTTFSDVSFVVQFLISLIGLGVAIDYSLLVVSRWREERAHGLENNDAIRVSMRTAGEAVLASGVTVAISLVALVVVPVPFLRSMGFGGMLIPLVSVAVVLTLLPAMLSAIGPRVDWPRVRKEGNASRAWSAWARKVVKHRVLATVAASVILAILIAPVFSLKIGVSSVDSLARSGPAYEDLQTLRDAGFGEGVLTPIEVLVPTGEARAAVEAARGVEGVQLAVVGGEKEPLAVIEVLPEVATVDSATNAVVDDVREAVTAAVDGEVLVTGVGANVEDYFSAVYDKFPYVLALIALITFVLLVRTFRSILLPVKAVLLNLVSLAAVFGSVVFFWQQGNGSDLIFDVSGTGAITFWLPVLIFAFLFGLSMDYEVFILARMREEYDAHGDTHQAVITGLGRTGRLVTSAALILFFAFVALASAPGTDIKLFGTALGVGILLDATIVRALLVPALVSLFGRWNWWLPVWLARLLRVEPSPLAPRNNKRRDPDDHVEPVLVGS